MIRIIALLSLCWSFALNATVTLTSAAGAGGNAVALQGRNVSATAPTSTQVLTWNSTTSAWTPAAAAGSSGADVNLSNIVSTAMGADLIWAASTPGYINTKDVTGGNSFEVIIRSGNVTTSGNAAHVVYTAGSVISGNGSAGPVDIRGANADTAATGGDIYITPGQNTALTYGKLFIDTSAAEAGGTGTSGQCLVSYGVNGEAHWATCPGAGGTTYTANQYGVALSSAANSTLTILAPDASTSKVLKSGGASANPSWLAYTDANTASTLVARDGSGNFSAGTITATLAGTASTATNATNTAITDDTTTNATMYPTWVTTASSNQAQKVSSTKLTFNPSTGMLTATGFTGPITGRINSTQTVETVVAGGTCSTTYTVDPTTGTMFNVTLNGACSFAVTNLVAGHSFTIKITQSATTAPTFTSAYKWTTATTPTFSTSATKYDMIACVSLDGTTLDCSALVDVR